MNVEAAAIKPVTRFGVRPNAGSVQTAHMDEEVGFWSVAESQSFEELIVEAPECFGGIGPGPGHPGFVYLDRARTSDEQTVYWLRHGGIDPHDVRVVEWEGRGEEIESSVRPVPSNMQSTRRGDTVHGQVVMWYALRPGGPAVVELSAEAEPIAGELAAAWGAGVLTIVGHLALPRLR